MCAQSVILLSVADATDGQSSRSDWSSALTSILTLLLLILHFSPQHNQSFRVNKEM